MRAQFILSEIGIGLRRNLVMTIAVVVTTALSLTFVGVAILLDRQVEEMKGYWYDRVEISLFLCGAESEAPSCAEGEVTQPVREQIARDLERLPQVESFEYESKEQAYARFQESFEDSSFADTVTADALPESYRVALEDPEQFAVVASVFEGRPGIEQVQDQRAVLEPLFSALATVQWIATGLAAAMMLVAVILIGTTIQLSAFSRRRETGIMRLVGASSLSIQLPFILEGALAGLVGALLAAGILAAILQFLVFDRLAVEFPFTSFIGWDALGVAVAFIVVIGVVLAALASFVTLLRYLRV